jgi:hypothetical protein
MGLHVVDTPQRELTAQARRGIIPTAIPSPEEMAELRHIPELCLANAMSGRHERCNPILQYEGAS